MTSKHPIYFTAYDDKRSPHNFEWFWFQIFQIKRSQSELIFLKHDLSAIKKMNILIRFMQYSARYTIERKELLQNRCFYTEQYKSILLIVVKSCMNNKMSIMNAWLVEQTVSIKRYILIPLKIFSQLYDVASLLFSSDLVVFPRWRIRIIEERWRTALHRKRKMQLSVTSLWSWISIDTFHKREI